MKIIKDKQIVEDNCAHLADDEQISEGNITVSFARWQQEKTDLSLFAGKIGVRIGPADNIEELADELTKLQQIVLQFPVFTDGRSFSQARLLRDCYQFKGDIRARGNYMTDQVFYLSRVGVNVFEFEKPEQLELALSNLNDFTVKYQPSTN